MDLNKKLLIMVICLVLIAGAGAVVWKINSLPSEPLTACSTDSKVTKALKADVAKLADTGCREKWLTLTDRDGIYQELRKRTTEKQVIDLRSEVEMIDPLSYPLCRNLDKVQSEQLRKVIKYFAPEKNLEVEQNGGFWIVRFSDTKDIAFMVGDNLVTSGSYRKIRDLIKGSEFERYFKILLEIK